MNPSAASFFHTKPARHPRNPAERTNFARRAGIALALIPVLVMSLTLASHADDQFKWDVKQQRVNADISRMPLKELLTKVAVATGWQIQCPPDVDLRVSARFTNLRPGDALERLLGTLNFAVVPGAPGQKTQLTVYGKSPGTELVQVVVPPGTPQPGSESLSTARRSQIRSVNVNGALSQFDTDGDGELSDRERLAIRSNRSMQVIQQFDTDGDGALSADEREAARIAMQERLRATKEPGFPAFPTPPEESEEEPE